MFCTKAEQGRNHLVGGREGKSGRILLRTLFYLQVINHIEDCKHGRHEELFCGISKSALLVDSCTYLQYEMLVLLLFGKRCDFVFFEQFSVLAVLLLIQLSWIKNHCYSSCGDESDWTWCSLLDPLVQRTEIPVEIKRNEYKGNSGQQETG